MVASPQTSSHATGMVSSVSTTLPAPRSFAERFADGRVHVAETVGGWRYTGGKRDLRIDFLRGFAVLVMVADHLGGEPSWLSMITGGNRFLFSAAEGFVFISGLVMGIVYAGIIARQGIGPAMWKALRRAGSLYLLTVVLTFAFISVSYLLHLPWVAGVTINDPVTRAIERLTLHRAFYLTDVLLMYTLLVAVAPLAFILLVNKRTPALLAGSWLLWGLYQRWPDQVTVPWTIEDNSVFHLAAWQVLFFTGLVIGYHRERIATWARRIPMAPYLTILTLLCAGLIEFHRYSTALLGRFSPDGDPTVLTARLFDKGDVRIGRLIAFAIFFQFFLALVTVAWQPLVKALGWFLLPLGQSALLAYGTHLFVIAFFTHYVMQIPGFRNTSALQNTVVQVAGIGIVFLVVQLTPALKRVTTATRATIGAIVAPSQQALATPQHIAARRER
ncbi:MAG: OpgC domain-containing protein [Chloroflexota bacterium]|nr:OpgC domain-containing protein [Chloroflexota bacterium]